MNRFSMPTVMPTAVILAAGRGNRLLPLTRDRPKCLLEVGPCTILEHQLRALGALGVASIQIVTGHCEQKVRAVCDGLATYAHNIDHATTNSLDSLGCTTVDVGPGGLVIMNSDVLFHPDLMGRLLADERENVLLADFDSELGEEEMKINVDDRNRIVEISKNLDPRAAHAENLGIVRLGPDAAGRFLQLARTRGATPNILWVPDAIHHLRNEIEFYALATDKLPWIEIDYPHDLERARQSVYPLMHEALRGGRE